MFFQFLQPGPIRTLISVAMQHSSSVLVPRHLKWVTLSSSPPIIFTGFLFPYSFCSKANSINWVFSLLTFIPLSLPVLFPRIQIYSVMFTYLPQQGSSIMSSANIMDSGSYFLTSFVSPSMSMRNRYGLKAERWCIPTSTLNMLRSPPATRAHWFDNLSTMSCISLTYFSGTLYSLVYIQTSPSVSYCLCLRMKIASMVLLLGMNQNYSFTELPCILAMGSGQFWVSDRIFCSMCQWASLRPTLIISLQGRCMDIVTAITDVAIDECQRKMDNLGLRTWMVFAGLW